MPRPVCVDRGLPCGIWSCLGWKGGADGSLARAAAEESAGVAEGAKSGLQEGLRQGVVYLLGMAVVCCLGHALVGEEP